MKTNYFKKTVAGFIIFLFAHTLTAQQYILIENFNGSFDYPFTNPDWVTQNNSNPAGYDWFQGFNVTPTTTFFPAYSGADTTYIAASFVSTDSIGDISNWVMTPEVTLTNGNIFKFYTRTVNHMYADRLQLYMSTDGGNTDVGNTATSVGTFSVLLKDINPSLTATGYPSTWTGYSVTVSGLSNPLQGRFGFRYFVTNGGSYGTNSNYIGIDSVTYYAPIYAGFSTIKGNNVTVSLYPNPVKNELIISGTNGSAQLFDITGRMVLASDFENGKAINTAVLDKGIYIVKVFDEKQVFIRSQKITKE